MDYGHSFPVRFTFALALLVASTIVFVGVSAPRAESIDQFTVAYEISCQLSNE